jgi:hypothetical protein
MLKKLVFVLVVLALLLPFSTSHAFAQGSCPTGFHIMSVADMDHEGGHHHVGTSADQNGDGYICVKHVTPDEGIHVHIDNNLP